MQRTVKKSYFYARSTSVFPLWSYPAFPFGMISPRCFSFHGVITICPVCGQRVFRQTSNKVLQPVSRDDEIPPACLRALLRPSKSCKKPSRDRGAISICACSKLLQHTAKQRELTEKEVFPCCGRNKLRWQNHIDYDEILHVVNV